MGFRTVVIRTPCKLSYKNECLIIRAEEARIIHLSEIHTLLIDSTMVTLTAYLLCALIAHKIKVIFCDERRNPLCELLPYYGCHNASGRLKTQLQWTKERKALVWQGIVRQKIRNQAALLKYDHPEEAEMLLKYAEDVEAGDATNREGHAAKVYFNRIFGENFNRNLKSDLNAYLNYGYTLILSTMNKELCAKGYTTQLGIHHRNEYNHFNLSSDLMEPFRCLVDRMALARKDAPFDKDQKTELLRLFRHTLRYQGKSYYFSDCVGQYVNAVTTALQTDDPLAEDLFYVYEDADDANTSDV